MKPLMLVFALVQLVVVAHCKLEQKCDGSDCTIAASRSIMGRATRNREVFGQVEDVVDSPGFIFEDLDSPKVNDGSNSRLNTVSGGGSRGGDSFGAGFDPFQHPDIDFGVGTGGENGNSYGSGYGGGFGSGDDYG